MLTAPPSLGESAAAVAPSAAATNAMCDAAEFEDLDELRRALDGGADRTPGGEKIETTAAEAEQVAFGAGTDGWAVEVSALNSTGEPFTLQSICAKIAKIAFYENTRF